jgi:hypothetical protein
MMHTAKLVTRKLSCTCCAMFNPETTTKHKGTTNIFLGKLVAGGGGCIYLFTAAAWSMSMTLISIIIMYENDMY